jgi:TrmH family RNA methyltransferase
VTLVLDGIQDPGNAGTLLRSAEAFGAAAVIGLKGTVDLFHPKVLRASAGSAFRVPVLRHAVWQDLDVPAGFLVAGAVARGGEPPASLNFREGAVLAVGNEGAGLSAGLRQCSTPVTISTCGVESLNAAVAGSILLYEAWLRR